MYMACLISYAGSSGAAIHASRMLGGAKVVATVNTGGIALIPAASFVYGVLIAWCFLNGSASHTGGHASGARRNGTGQRSLPRPLVLEPPAATPPDAPELRNGIGTNIKVYTYADSEDHPEAQRVRETCSSRVQVGLRVWWRQRARLGCRLAGTSGWMAGWLAVGGRCDT